MINSFDRWLREMAGMERHICKKRKEDTEEAREGKDKPKRRHRDLREARKEGKRP